MVRRSSVLWVLGIVAATAVATAVFGRSIAQTATAAVVGALLLKLGIMMIKGLAQPVPEPPEPGELRKVKLTYRCEICGAEVRMTVAATADPEPPRHCLEDMVLITPIE